MSKYKVRLFLAFAFKIFFAYTCLYIHIYFFDFNFHRTFIGCKINYAWCSIESIPSSFKLYVSLEDELSSTTNIIDSVLYFVLYQSFFAIFLTFTRSLKYEKVNGNIHFTRRFTAGCAITQAVEPLGEGAFKRRVKPSNGNGNKSMEIEANLASSWPQHWHLLW